MTDIFGLIDLPDFAKNVTFWYDRIPQTDIKQIGENVWQSKTISLIMPERYFNYHNVPKTLSNDK